MSAEGTIACKTCGNVCRLVLGDIVAIEMYGELSVYNLWQCNECGQLWREKGPDVKLSKGHK